MLPRFFVPGTHAAESVVALPDDEARHLTRVLRLSAGEAVRVFDGRGREWHGIVDLVSKQRVTVRLEHDVAPLAEPGVAITLAIAVLKGDKMDDVVRDAVMLGVAAIQPLITERTEVALNVIERSDRVRRWQRIAVASAKQCGRAVVPTIHDAIRFQEVLTPMMEDQGFSPAGCGLMEGKGFSPADPDRRFRPMPTVLLAEPQAGETAQRLGDVPRSADVLLLVGPEGGWTAREVRLAQQAGAMLVTLGHQILRADAVPIVALTALRVAFGDL